MDGKLKEWYKSGQLRKEIDFKNGKYDGKRLTYWRNGNLKRIDNFEDDKLVDGKCFGSDGADTVYYNYETFPEFPGGEEKLYEYLRENTIYPLNARKKGAQGNVLVRFVVTKIGTISNVEITQGINKELDDEAMRIIKAMPKWIPGTQDGQAVNVYFILPIIFQLY